MNFNGFYLLFWDKTLGIPAEEQCDLLAFMLCIICKMTFCGDHSPSHDCIGTHRSHMKSILCRISVPALFD